MRYISLFSGVEAASVAWEPLGWEPVAFAEVEPFPCAVLEERFPGVPNLGDVTKVDWREWRGKADLVVGGSPCQAFSVAGLRKGLADPRGNLMLEYLRACYEIGPEWIVWENVPGVLSADGRRAFQAFLEAVVELWPGGGSAGGCWTLSSSEWPSDAAVCSLSSILETGDGPLRYCLSATACAGILRRAATRGKPLPGFLEAALWSVVLRHLGKRMCELVDADLDQFEAKGQRLALPTLCRYVADAREAGRALCYRRA